MRRKSVLVSTIAAVGTIAVILGGYVYWQYRTATPAALGGIPIYSARQAVSLADIPETQRSDAEAKLRVFASTAEPGYRVDDERFLATKGPLTWDAVRHHIGSYLTSHSYAPESDRLSSDNMIAYLLYEHDGMLRRKFNDDKILVAGLLKTTVRTATGDEAHLYAYFRLTPS